MHRTLGYLLVLPVLLLVVLALIRRERRLIGLTAALIVLIIVQVLLPSLRTSVPWLAALHPINALALMGLTAGIARAAQPKQADARQDGARDVQRVQTVLGSS
jgi:heme A synthase